MGCGMWLVRERWGWFGLLVAAFLAGLVSAAPAQQPEAQEVLLTVTDATGQAHGFDRLALDSLPQVTFETGTLWTEAPSQFSGPALRHILAEAGILSGKISLQALNEYSVELSVEELTDTAPIVATRRDGALFGVRDNGPLWVIYPFDSDLVYQAEEVYAASVWQLVEVRALGP